MAAIIPYRETIELEKAFASAMKSIARRADLKTHIEQTPALYSLLNRAAARYVTGESRSDGLAAQQRLMDKGYAVSLEYIGENTTNLQDCEDAQAELSQLISDLSTRNKAARVSFDLSHIGLLLDHELTYRHLIALAEQAKHANIELFISMEESAKTDDILAIYKRAARDYSHIGITLQAQLNRTEQDLIDLSSGTSRIRLVKGAYQEPESISIARSSILNERYLRLIEQAVEQGHLLSIATHDESIIDEVVRRGWIQSSAVEFEMLYGIRPDLSCKLNAAGHPVRIYLTYGQEWYLYLCHRIAEYPPNLFQAVLDMSAAEQLDPLRDYNGKNTQLVPRH